MRGLKAGVRVGSSAEACKILATERQSQNRMKKNTEQKKNRRNRGGGKKGSSEAVQSIFFVSKKNL